MASLTPNQRRWRDRIERVIRVAAPGLDLVLAVGDRISRLGSPNDPPALATPPSPDGPVRRVLGTGR